MRYVRFTMDKESELRFGVVEGNSILECRGDLFDQPSLTGNSFSMTDVILKAPLTPRHIIGIGKNFAGEGESKPKPPELPIFFFKPLTSVVGPNEPILLPRGAAQVKYESELAVIIGRPARNIAPEEADDFIFGFTVANDVGSSRLFSPGRPLDDRQSLRYVLSARAGDRDRFRLPAGTHPVKVERRATAGCRHGTDHYADRQHDRLHQPVYDLDARRRYSNGNARWRRSHPRRRSGRLPHRWHRCLSNPVRELSA